ncbi:MULTISPECIES: hypothetical protein [Bacillus]|uniref:hypothetical protein n=1 Tax=Bacillus TaxID=1386 RepID=UPI000505763B|nr:hypothetical protein [Bacillus pseudomycoides]KFN11002.1 hypothetical protein DJ94_5421 [Bacillus pseudomycoides]MED0857639.1 hypothetical protein [Bacillus pseudomycoides]MED1535388.1 hypothetical protein [Bacillus pseudomycoides]MED1625243.1 hypothetical protein [Bacillus pseudomycoides]MED4654725.1 hypothetical protein [Bacillus pseudomycoides]
MDVAKQFSSCLKQEKKSEHTVLLQSYPKHRESRVASLNGYATINNSCNSLYTEKAEPI